MAEDPWYIKAWLKNADRIIRVSKQEERRQTHEKTMMENYFNWRPSSKLPRKKRKCIQHMKQDLCPDWRLDSCPRKRAASGSTIQIEWRDRTLISSFEFFLPLPLEWCPYHPADFGMLPSLVSQMSS
jgi:hypothetical protein